MIVCFWIPTAFGCTELVDPARMLSADEGVPDMSGGICPEGTYSGMGYLLLQPKEAAIKTLFSRTMKGGATLTVSNLIMCYIIIYATTLVTFGAAIPVGLFIPNILAGACLGRAGAQVLVEMGCDLRPDVYALIGAAGALAGFSRMTISLAMIFLEITNNVYMLLPLMLVIMTSKVVADRFNPSVYDIVLECRPDIHLLEDDLSEDRRLILDELTAHDACSADVVVLREFEPLSHIVSLLMQTSFDGYPVVDAHNRLIGIVNRVELSAFAKKAYTSADQMSNDLVPVHSMCVTSPEVTLWSTPVTRAFHHFRAIGLKHLCVVSSCHELLGILTRTDFAHLCAHGVEGREHIHMLITRKLEAIEEGKVELANQPEPWQLRHNTKIPTGSTVGSRSGESSSRESSSDRDR
jgi:chloride channel 7